MKLILTTLSAFALVTTLASAEDKPAGPGGRHGHHEHGEMFKKLDTNNDGAITEAEFKAGPRAQQNPAKAAEIFKKMDKDNNGSVTAAEIKAGRPDGGPGKGRGGCKKHGGKGGPAPAAA